MKKIIVLGAGMVGSAIAIDLAKNHQVCSADINDNNFEKLQQHKIKTVKIDLSKSENIKNIVQEYDLVVGAVPGFMGYATCKAVIEAKKNIVDISFFPENAFELDELAKQSGVTAIVDCGVAPGMGNIILGFHNRRMKIENYKCYVGGLPLKREKPLIQSPFFAG